MLLPAATQQATYAAGDFKAKVQSTENGIILCGSAIRWNILVPYILPFRFQAASPAYSYETGLIFILFISPSGTRRVSYC